MKPVYQTRFTIPEGNCFAACIASLLEVELEAVDFRIKPIPGKENYWTWIGELNKVLNPFGYRWVDFSLELASSYPLQHLYGQLCIFTGKSPRFENSDINHCCVGRVDGIEGDESATFTIVHDPIPNGNGFNGKTPLHIGFFTPINPEAHGHV